MDTKDVFTQEVRKALSIRAVNQLIADAEAGLLMNNKDTVRGTSVPVIERCASSCIARILQGGSRMR